MSREKLVTWYKFTFAVCRKRGSKSLYYSKCENIIPETLIKTKQFMPLKLVFIFQ